MLTTPFRCSFEIISLSLFSLEMCKKEYAMRQKKKNVYHMGLVTRVGAEKSLAGVSDERFRRHYPVPPEPVAARFKASVKMHHNSIYIAGEQNHFSYFFIFYWSECKVVYFCNWLALPPAVRI